VRTRSFRRARTTAENR